MRALTESATAREAVEAMLLAAAESCCRTGKPRGCPLVLAAVNCTQANRGVQEHLRKLRSQRLILIRRRLERGVAEGDVPEGTDLRVLCSFFATVVDGLALQARDGASRSSLIATVRCAMAAWDQMAGVSKRVSRAARGDSP
jgi:AcrR family transcriptional regulator